MLDPPDVGGTEPPDDAEDFVSPLEEELCEVGTILSGNPGDNCTLRHVVNPKDSRRCAGSRQQNGARPNEQDRVLTSPGERRSMAVRGTAGVAGAIGAWLLTSNLIAQYTAALPLLVLLSVVYGVAWNPRIVTLAV